MKFSRIGAVDIGAIEKYFAFSMNVSLMLAVLFLQFLIGEAAIAATDQLNVEPQFRKDLISRKVRVGLYENKPKIYTGEAGVASGIFPDILEEIARKEKWQLSYVPCEWVGCLDALEKGRIDLMPDVAFTPDRNDQFDFHTEEVVGSWSAVYAKSRKQMSKIADLNGRRIAVLEGSIQQTILEQMVGGFGFQVTFIEAKSFEEAYSLMANGAADAVVSNHFFGDYFHQQYGLEKTPIVFNPVSLYFATASGANPDLLKAIDYHLRVMKSEPGSVYYKALVRWMEEPTVVIVPPYLIWIIGGVSGLLVLAFMFILLLRWQVRVGTRHLAKANEMLRDSEKMFRDLFHQHAAVKLLIDPDTGNIVEANEAAEKFYGWSREQLRRMRIQDINTLSPEQVKAEKEKAKNLQRIHFEFRHRLANGSVKDVGVFTTKIDIQGKPLLHSIIHDITERKRAEEALQRSQQLFSSLFRTNPAATILSELVDGRCVDANEAYAKLVGYTREELIGKTTVGLNIWISAEERQRVVTELPQKDHLENVELTLRKKNGDIINTVASGEVFTPGGQRHMLFFFFDITERKKAEKVLQERTLELQHLTETLEERVKERTAELADLTSRLVSAHEDERKRVSYDLHDNVWQTLLTIWFEIERLFSDQEDWAALRDKSKQVMTNIVSLVGKIRSMQGDLWPYVLDDIGLAATIDWYCREFEKNHSGLSIEIKNDLTDGEVPSSAKIVIYRIMQETLDNVAKYSQASRVTLHLKKREDGMEFTLEDNGIGFDPEETIVKRAPLGGLGLLSIKARTELSGGVFGVESAKGKGTTVRASWPL
jgi:PAS domain S-box-containing protein